MTPHLLKTLLLICLTALCSVATAAPAVWAVHGKSNTLYLVGTIHALPANETLPINIKHAYDDAKQLLLEVDTDTLDPFAAQAAMLSIGVLPPGQTLQQQLDADTYRQLQSAAGNAGMDLALFANLQPWLAAVLIEQLELTRLGYSVESGIEMQLTAQAKTDNKPIRGLETLEEQLNVFAQLDRAGQRDYLRYTLSELKDMPAELDALLVAWHNGDETQLRNLLQAGLSANPKLFNALTTDRNHRWLVVLKSLLSNEHDNYLVAVGALHLIGDDGVVSLLRKAGYTVTRY